MNSFVPCMALRSGLLNHRHRWAFKNTCRADPHTTIKSKGVKFVLQETSSDFFQTFFHFAPVRIETARTQMSWSVSWVNPLKALKNTQENRVTKGGGFKLAVGFMSPDLNRKKTFSDAVWNHSRTLNQRTEVHEIYLQLHLVHQNTRVFKCFGLISKYVQDYKFKCIFSSWPPPHVLAVPEVLHLVAVP